MDDLLDGLSPVSLDEVDERAALQRRVDHKYLIPRADLVRLIEALAEDHDVLEIDGRRVFGYESAYFDTPDLRCFEDHVQGRAPRHKVRSRLYRDSGLCQFEVKTKQTDGETAKDSMETDAACHGRLDEEIRRFLSRALPPSFEPDSLRLSLLTRFDRATLAAREERERVTIDHGLTLVAPDGDARRLDDGCFVVETKTADGDGRADRVLRELGQDTISMSKYRMGIGLLLADDADPPLADRRHRLFKPASDGAAAGT